jgi:hypothetical protein
MREGMLPFPLLRVTGQFWDTSLAAVVDEFGFAGLELPLADKLFESTQQTGARRPLVLDGPASTDLEIALAKNASAFTHFLGIGNRDDQIVSADDSDKYPRPYLTRTPEADTQNPSGQPSLRYGPIDLPMDKPLDQPLRLYPRDMFGRWPAPESGACHLDPWPVGVPGLLSVVVEYSDDYKISIRVVAQWDRSIRRQKDFMIGIRLVAVKGNDKSALNTPFLPPFQLRTATAMHRRHGGA